MSLMTIKMNEGLEGLIVVVTLDNGDEWYMEGHDGGISIITQSKGEKVIDVGRFSPTSIVIKQK